MIRIAVTELEYRKGRPVWESAEGRGFHIFSAPAGEQELASFIRREQVRHAVVGVERYEGALYEALQRGSVLARYGVGHDGIDKARATEKGILCTNTPEVLDDSVAEYTIALIIAAARHICPLVQQMGDGRWAPRVGTELRGKTLAVIGCGAIGRRVAQIASAGLGMRVVGCEVARVDAAMLKTRFGFAEISPDFAETVRAADFVSLHIPSTPETRRYIDAPRLTLLPCPAWLINTARGAIVDEVALFDALKAGALAGAALDVFEREPYEPVRPDKDLRRLPNVILTPHVASSTQEACNRTAETALNDIRLAEAGRFTEMHLLNSQVVERLKGRA